MFLLQIPKTKDSVLCLTATAISILS